MSKNECYHEQRGRVAAGRFMSLKSEVLPEVLRVALERGLSISRPIIQLTLDDVYDTSEAPDSSITVRLQMHVEERPTYQTLKDFYHDLSGSLISEFMDKQARGKFEDEVVLIDATQTTVVELDEETTKQVGAMRVALTMTYLEDVTSDIESALIVHVDE